MKWIELNPNPLLTLRCELGENIYMLIEARLAEEGWPIINLYLTAPDWLRPALISSKIIYSLSDYRRERDKEIAAMKRRAGTWLVTLGKAFLYIDMSFEREYLPWQRIGEQIIGSKRASVVHFNTSMLSLRVQQINNRFVGKISGYSSVVAWKTSIFDYEIPVDPDPEKNMRKTEEELERAKARLRKAIWKLRSVFC